MLKSKKMVKERDSFAVIFFPSKDQTTRTTTTTLTITWSRVKKKKKK